MKTISITACLCLLLFFAPIILPAGEGGRVRLPDELKIYNAQVISSQQAFAKSNSPWRTFTTVNDSWRALWNPLTNNPHRAWGKGIQINGFNSINETNAADAGWKFLSDNASVLNLQPKELRLLQSENVNGKWYFKFKQQYNGLDVLNTFVDLRAMPDGRVFVFGSDFIQNMNVNTTPALGKTAAMEFAKVGLDYRPGTDYIEGGQLYILPLKFDTKIDSRLVYNFIINQSVSERWYTCVDAHSGEVLWRYNLVMNFTGEDGPQKTASTIHGRVTAIVYPVSYIYDSTEVPLFNSYVTVAGNRVITDMNGEFTVDIGSATTAGVSAKFTGPYGWVRRGDAMQGGKEGAISKTVTTGSDVNIQWNFDNSHPDERTMFYHLNVVRNFIRGIDPSSDLSGLDGQMQAIVRSQGDTCNAAWDGSKMVFLTQGTGSLCNDPALIADVLYHEYGHAINQFYYLSRSGQPMQNGALGEGTADINANMLRDNPVLGPGFLKGGPNDGALRTSDNTNKYPNDIVNEVHTDGQIIAGAMWDVRKAIGIELARKYSHFVKKSTPDDANTGKCYVEYLIDLLTLDDDDGNLANGTPHSNGIITAFLKHGIPAYMVLTHTPIPDQDGLSQNGYPISASITTTQVVPNSINVAPQTAQVIWSLDNWKTSYNKTLNMSGGTTIQDQFPNQKAGSIVRYYLDVTDNFGISHRLPTNAPLQSYLFLVGYETRLLDKMETDDKWKVDPDGSDLAETGIWVRATPVSPQALSKPAVDHSPGTGETKCWITGNKADGGTRNDDIDDGQTTLQTVLYNLSSYQNPVLRYWRWYSNDQGATPGTDTWVVLISSDNGKSWVDLERTKQSIHDWVPMVFPVKDYITPTDSVLIRFIGSDLDTPSLVGCAVDDFELLDINASINPVQETPIATNVQLGQNYPNPATINGMNTTSISYSIPAKMYVTLKVYSTFGQEIKTLVASEQEGGSYTATFNASNLPSGVYMYELRAGDVRLTKKMICVR